MIRTLLFIILLMMAGCAHCERVQPIGPTVCEW